MQRFDWFYLTDALARFCWENMNLELVNFGCNGAHANSFRFSRNPKSSRISAVQKHQKFWYAAIWVILPDARSSSILLSKHFPKISSFGERWLEFGSGRHSDGQNQSTRTQLDSRDAWEWPTWLVFKSRIVWNYGSPKSSPYFLSEALESSNRWLAVLDCILGFQSTSWDQRGWVWSSEPDILALGAPWKPLCQNRDPHVEHPTQRVAKSKSLPAWVHISFSVFSS